MDDKSSTKNSTHIRRCHVCGTVNEKQQSLVDRCECCGKVLAPFLFCDNNGEQSPQSTEKPIPALSPEEFVRSIEKDRMHNRPARNTIYPPLWGLAVYWENESNPG